MNYYFYFTFFLATFLFSFNAQALNISNYLSPENKNRDYRPHTRYIVLHTTEGAEKGSLRKVYKNGEANYFVGCSGHVYRIIHKDRIALHAGVSMWNGKREVDNYAIGIEIVGYHDEYINARQYKTLKELINQLQMMYNISDNNVLTHSMVAYGNPNRWHRHAHRGRKRCGMLFALKSVRKKLGLSRQPSYDPDVKHGRLTVGDLYLAKVLYGTRAEQKEAFLQFRNKKFDIIAKGRSAWDIALDNYNKSSTLYVFPNGKRIYGNKIKNWKTIPAGTRVKVNHNRKDKGKRNIKTLGLDGITASEVVGEKYNHKTTIYLMPEGKMKLGNVLKKSDFLKMPENTKILIGYVYGGKVTEKNSAFDICNISWNTASTFYRLPDGNIVSGININEDNIPKNSLVFCEV